MRISVLLLAAFALCTVWAGSASAGPVVQAVKAADTEAAQRWVSDHWTVPASTKPSPAFSFVLDGTPSSAFLASWKAAHDSRRLDAHRTQRVTTYSDPLTKLSVRCVATIYRDFPAVEWTVYFKNNGDQDSPILEKVQALDADWPLIAAPGACRLLYSLGSHEAVNDFAPQEKTLDAPLHLAPYGGRSSDGVLPFFNLAGPDGHGAIVGIGWTGQWAATLTPNAAGAVTIQAGMEHTHLRLHPGEEIRSPAILMLFWSGGDPVEGNNLLRRLLLKHYSPTPNGKAVQPPVAASPHGTIAFSDTTEANMVQAIANIAEHRFPVDTYWIDAGWNGEQAEWARAVGTWTPNPRRFPNGMKPVADAAHARGLRFLLWMEPERVMPDTWLFNNHPDWLLSPANVPAELKYQENDRFRLLNLGNPDALAWLKTTFSKIIGETGIDIYRQDFNLTPLYYWRNGEAPDREGMNEIRHVTGLYDFYDTLLREHPGLLIDNCASGGRRIDFEIMSRALSLFRSDYCWDPIGAQGMTYGLSPWMPITGLGAVKMDAYDFRSGLGAHLTLALNYFTQPDLWVPAAAALTQYQGIRHLFTADFYPLTPYSLDKDKWIAWQYAAPESREGLVQAFRRDACTTEAIELKLRALDPKLHYVVVDLDTAARTERTGRELMEDGLTVRIPAAPGAALLHYMVRK